MELELIEKFLFVYLGVKYSLSSFLLVSFYGVSIILDLCS